MRFNERRVARGLYVCCLVQSTTERCDDDGLRDACVAHRGGAVLMTKSGRLGGDGEKARSSG